MIKLCVFDLDGTLLDTLSDLHAAVNFALEKYAFPKRSKDEVCSFVGNGIAMLIRRAIGKETPLFESVLQAFKEYYAAHCADETKPYDGIMPLLESLQKQGIKTAVVSNKADFAVKSSRTNILAACFWMRLAKTKQTAYVKSPLPIPCWQ